jgi:hypothetical protein
VNQAGLESYYSLFLIHISGGFEARKKMFLPIKLATIGQTTIDIDCLIFEN